MNQQPIGIFDSGVGGLTVARAIHHLLPEESLVYYGDTAHLPYGDKSAEAIQEFSLSIARFLVERKKAKAIVVACNSASAVAYDLLKSELGDRVPVLNVIDPVAAFVSGLPKVEHVGVIGTRATISSDTYPRKIRERNPQLRVKSLATPLLVPIIEEGLADSNLSSEAIRHYLNQKHLEDIEALILGCTHYPLILNDIRNFYRGKIEIVDSPVIVANTLKAMLNEMGLRYKGDDSPSFRFFISDYTSVFERLASLIFGDEIHLVEENIWH